MEKLEASWRRLVKPEDTVVLAGDISWSMRLADTRKDFAFLNGLPGRKLIMKGNHDYWWSTANKMNAFFRAEGFDTLRLLHNNSYTVEGYALCDALEAACPAERITVHASLTALPFFEGRGYRVARQQKVIRHGVVLTNFLMEKNKQPSSEK